MKKDKSYSLSDLRRIIGLVFNASPKLAFKLLIVQALIAIFPSLLIIVIKNLIDLFNQPDQLAITSLYWALALYIAIQVLSAICSQISAKLILIYQERLVTHISIEVIQKAMTVEYTYYENSNYHNTLHLAQQQAIHKSAQLLINLSIFIQQFLTLFILGAYLFSVNWLYAFIFICIPIPVSILKAYYSREGFILEKDLTEKERQLAYYQHLATSALYAKEIRTFSISKFILDRYSKLRAYIFEKKKSLSYKQSRYLLLLEIMEIIIISSAFIFLAKKTYFQIISTGTFILYLQSFQRVQQSAKTWMQSITVLYQQRLLLNQLFQFLDLPKKEQPIQVKFPHHLEKIIISTLQFSYPDSSKAILNAISFTAQKGEFIGIVGENGSGKSTLIKLLSNLYNNYIGEILLNDVSLKKISPESFWENSATLFQDYEKYYFSVGENIILGKSVDVVENIESIKKAAHEAGADYIQGLPNQFFTPLGRTLGNGAQLSGGQWQKLSLARVFYRSTQLLILDEPGSFLDAKSEAAIIKELLKQKQNRITILVTHRLYTLKEADKIIVMREGSIIESGKYEHLMSTDSYFKEMAKNQLFI